MTFLPCLPFCRQPLPARRKLFADLRHLIKTSRHPHHHLPRTRIRSLDVIPLALSLPRHSPLITTTQNIDPSASLPIKMDDLGLPLFLETPISISLIIIYLIVIYI